MQCRQLSRVMRRVIVKLCLRGADVNAPEDIMAMQCRQHQLEVGVNCEDAAWRVKMSITGRRIWAIWHCRQHQLEVMRQL